MNIWTNSITKSHYLLLAILFIAAIIYSLNFNFVQVGIFSDDAAYIVLAKSIATGQGYARVNFPEPEPEVAWPMGYPLLISPLLALWPFDYTPLKLFSLFLTLLSIVILWKYLQFRITSGYALLVILLYALNDDVVNSASFVMSEPAYLIWSLLGLYCLHRFEKDQFRKWYQIPLLALMLIMTALTRLLGISLAVACILALLKQRQLKTAIIIGLIFSVGILPQIMLGRQAGGELFPPEVAAQVDVSTNYVKALPNLSNYIFHHIPEVSFGLFAKRTFDLADQYSLLWLVYVVKYGLVLLILLSFLRVVTRKLEIGELYLLVYFAVISIKTWDGVNDTTPRYLMPLLPLIYLYFINGLDWSAGWLANCLARPIIVPATLACLIIPTLLILNFRNITNASHPFVSTDISAGAAWIAANAEPDAIIMSKIPLQHHLYARRLTTHYPEVPDEQILFEEIERQHIAYILVGPEIQHTHTPELDEYQLKYLLPVLERYPDRFQLMYTDEAELVSVYRVLPGSSVQLRWLRIDDVLQAGNQS